MGLFELIYYTGYTLKKYYDLIRQKYLPARVVCLGNLTTGGAGKTPATIALAREALRRGFRPCVLTRGYKGSLKGPVMVTDKMKERDVGDEPLLMAHKLSEIPIVKGKNRYDAGMYALHKCFPPPDLFILDDGFQHRRLSRDMDILLINSQNPFDNGRLLPMGNLREPISQIKRADIVVLTKCDGSDNGELVELVRKYNSQAPLYEARHFPSHISNIEGDELPLDEISGKRVLAFCGLAEPESFEDSLEQVGARVQDIIVFKDHYRYSSSDIAEIEDAAKRVRADWIITTEKDIMRIANAVDRIPLDMVSLGVKFDVEEDFYDRVFEVAPGQK